MKDIDASQKVQVSSSFRQPEKQFQHQRGHRRARAVIGTINMTQNTTIAVKGVKHQQTENMKKTLKTDSMVFRSFNNYLIITSGKRHTERHPDIERKVALHCQS